jgi:tetratricopeptide (TPR) repeat protein
MNFSGRFFLPLLALLTLAEMASCQRQISPPEKAARDQLRLTLRAKQWNDAIPLAHRVIEFSPGDDGAWARLARAQIGMQDLVGLKQTLDQWSQRVRHRSFKFHEFRGDLAHLERRRQDALADWEKAVAHKGREARLFIKIARVEQANRRWQEAALAWSRALATRENVESLLKRAACYHHLHSWTAEMSDLRRAQELAPEHPVVRQELARFDRLAKFLEEVRELDQKQRTSPNDAGLLGDRALLFLRAGDPALALDDAEAAAKISPTAVRPQLFRIIARGELENSPEKPQPERLSRLEDFSPQFLETIARLDAEIAAEPTNSQLLTHRAWHLNETAQPDFALADARKAQMNDPKSAGAYAEAAYALSKLNQRPTAYDEIKRAVELDPKFATAWQYRGELEMGQGDYAKAVESLTRALEINQTAAALTARESCYRNLGLIDKAEEDEKSLEQFR